MSIGNATALSTLDTTEKRMFGVRRFRNLVAAFLAVLTLSLVLANPAAAQTSPGCTAANSGAFNFDFDNSGGAGVLNIAQVASFGNAAFNVGDVITVTVTVTGTGAGNVAITGQPPQVFNQNFSSSGGANLNVINNTGGTTSAVAFTLAGNVNAGGRIQVTFTCTPAAGAAAAAAQAQFVRAIADSLLATLPDIGLALFNFGQNIEPDVGNLDAVEDLNQLGDNRLGLFEASIGGGLPEGETGQLNGTDGEGGSGRRIFLIGKKQAELDALERELADIDQALEDLGKRETDLEEKLEIALQNGPVGTPRDLEQVRDPTGLQRQVIADPVILGMLKQLDDFFDQQRDLRERKEANEGRAKTLEGQLRLLRRQSNDGSGTARIKPAGNPASPLAASRLGADGGHVKIDVDEMVRASVSPAGDENGSAARRTPYDVWLATTIEFFDDDQRADRDGTLFSLTAGVARKVSRDITVGGQLTYKNGNVESNTLNAELDSDFFGGSLFARLHLGRGVLLDAAAAYEHGWHDLAVAGTTGDFDTDSLALGGRLSKRYAVSRDWWIEPNLGLTYSHIGRNGFTDSTGTRNSSGNIERTRFVAGPKVGYVFKPAEGPILGGQVTLSINGVFDLTSNNNETVATGLVAKDPTSGVQVSSGVNLLMLNGMTAQAGISYTGLESLDSYNATLGLTIPLN